MTTTVKVDCPEHASWEVDVVVTDDGVEVQHHVLKKGESEFFTVYGQREVTVKEVQPL